METAPTVTAAGADEFEDEKDGCLEASASAPPATGDDETGSSQSCFSSDEEGLNLCSVEGAVAAEMSCEGTVFSSHSTGEAALGLVGEVTSFSRDREE